MNHLTIGFIGAGKMATAFIGGLVRAGHPPEHIWVSCPTQTHLDLLQTRFGVHTSLENTVIAVKADILILAVKPQQMPIVLTELGSVIDARIVISIAAGISVSTITAALGDQVSVIRAMPNTPALVGQGMTVFYAKQSISQRHKQEVQAIFQGVGTTSWIDDENQMSTITAISGSGPAYFFLLMEVLEKAGLALGLSREIAHQLVIQTAVGSAQMALASTEDMSELRRQVTSPGGGTEAALRVLASNQFAQLILDAVTAAKMRYEAME